MKEFRVTGRFVLLALISFFLCIIAANAIFISLAVRSFPGEQVEKSYLQGLRYNDTIAARRAQESLGWRASIAIARKGADARIELTIRDRASAPLSDLDVSGMLARPADNNDDRKLAFTRKGAGVYAVEIAALPRGVWRLETLAKGVSGDEVSTMKIETKITIE
jgi:nitrogen fixation protein FixH